MKTDQLIYYLARNYLNDTFYNVDSDYEVTVFDDNGRFISVTKVLPHDLIGSPDIIEDLLLKIKNYKSVEKDVTVEVEMTARLQMTKLDNTNRSQLQKLLDKSDFVLQGLYQDLIFSESDEGNIGFLNGSPIVFIGEQYAGCLSYSEPTVSLKVYFTGDAILEVDRQELVEGWLQTVKTKWHPPPGTFTKDPKTIAEVIAKASKSLQQAVARVNFYYNRKGCTKNSKDKECKKRDKVLYYLRKYFNK